MNDYRDTVRMFVMENFLFDNEATLIDTASFLDEGIIDSTGILELVSFIEERFRITVADDELIPENLDSVANVVNYLERKAKRLGGYKAKKLVRLQAS
ncbi:MAG: acyl carrier protein [Thermodesulfobacteriota bacterium]|nr:acyl carrier protein [Thermodesulfobacteriota bacterium]